MDCDNNNLYREKPETLDIAEFRGSNLNYSTAAKSKIWQIFHFVEKL